MKQTLLFLTLLISLTAGAQNRDEIALLGGTRNLQLAIFGSRDSIVLSNLFARQVSYGHSGGKLENREEAIRNIVHNKSTYTGLEIGPINVLIEGNSAVTRHQLIAEEHKADGTTVPLKLHIIMMWTKEKKSWKMLARQAVKVS